MHESTPKKLTAQKRQYNKLVVKRLMEKHGFSKMYIHQSLREERNSESSEKIRKDYTIMCKEVEAVLNK
jgi:hypothetical protein